MHKNIEYPHSFLSGGGEMGQRIREYNWDSSSLGNPSSWPQSLKMAMRLMLSSRHPMLIWWGPDLIQFYNDGYRPSIGSDRHPSVLGKKGSECWAEIWPIIGPQIEQVMSGEGTVLYENALIPITRNGRLEDVYWTYSYNPIYDEDAPHQVGGVLVIVTETTCHVQAQQRDKAQEARWRNLFASAPAFMCIYSGPDHVYEYANNRYYDLVGTTDVLGKTLREVVPEVFEQGFGDLLDFIYTTGQTHVGIATPVTLVGRNGNKRNLFLDFVLQPIRNAENEITGIFANGYDVTERIKSQLALEEQDKRKDEFLAMLAHELRNPLAPISSATELLTQIAPHGSTPYSLGELIKRQVGQLTRLIDDLLEVSRISQGRMQLQLGPVLLNHAVEFAVESTSVMILEKKLHLTYDCLEKHLLVNGDYARLVQSIVNLLINATKYTQHGGKINISLRSENNQAIIDVIDSGIGIEANMLEKIFELFVQVDKSIDRSQSGLGIGLSIVNTIIKMHGGKVSAYSDGLGKGAKFSISLPLLEPEKSSLHIRKEQALPSMKFLLVDDNEDAANSLSMLLEIIGHTTKVVYKGIDALESMAREKFDVILLDIGLPDIDGYRVAQKIRANDSNIIIIAVTGYGQSDDVTKAITAGCSGHLTKPVSLDVLETKLASLLKY